MFSNTFLIKNISDTASKMNAGIVPAILNKNPAVRFSTEDFS